jgi:hypothetical protein
VVSDREAAVREVDEIVKRVHSELTAVLQNVRQEAHPYEAAGFGQRVQTVLDMLRQVQVPEAQ